MTYSLRRSAKSNAPKDALRLLLPKRKRYTLSGTLYKKLDDYQQHAVGWSLERNAAALLFEQGTGKTWIAGGVIEQLWGKQFSALLVVPLANIETTWLDFLRSNFPKRSIHTTWDDFNDAPDNRPRVLVLHYEAVPKLIKKLRRFPWTLIAYDESQRLKAGSTLQSRRAKMLADSAERKLILSGTPLDKSPQDLWAQFRFLAPHVFGTRKEDFEDEYLEPLPVLDPKKYPRGSMRFMRALRKIQWAKRKRKFDYSKLPQFLEKIKPYALRVTKEVLNLPPLRFRKEAVTLTGQQRDIYDEIEHDFLSRHFNVSAPLKITRIGKLQQICGGYVFDDDGDIHEVGRAKQNRLLAIIRRERKPVVVFCRYLEEVESIRHDLVKRGKRVGVLTGKQRRERPAIIKNFQAGAYDVLVAQIKTGGVGIDLFRASTGIFFSMTYSYIDFEQAVSRLHRRGQKKAVNIFLIYARGTIDEVIYQAILSKGKVSKRVLDFLKRRTSYGSRKIRVQVRRGTTRQASRYSARIGSRRAA